jgi:hypothetical protein
VNLKSSTKAVINFLKENLQCVVAGMDVDLILPFIIGARISFLIL